MSLLNALPGAIAQGLIWGIMAIGLYITYKVLNIADLTVDGSIVTGAAVCAVLVASGTNVWLAMLCALLAGAACGLITGIFHTLMGIPAILAGILTQLLLWSVNLKILGKANLSISARTYSVVISQLNIGVAIAVGATFVVVLIGVLYWFFGTERGCSIRATGNNPNMSRAQGINTSFNTVLGLMISNAVVALSGALLSQYQGFADINMGRGAIVIGLAAVIIGEAIVSKISRNFAVTLVGVAVGGVVYYFVYQIVIWLGLDTELLKMFSALIVAIFLAVPYWKKRWFSGRSKKPSCNAVETVEVSETELKAENIETVSMTEDNTETEVKADENTVTESEEE